MIYTITLRDPFIKALDQMVTETTGMDATAIVLSIVEESLSPVVDRMNQAIEKSKLVALDAAKDTDTKAVILAAVVVK